MALNQKTWEPISVTEMIAEWVMSERHFLAQALGPLFSGTILRAVDHPDTADPSENHLRTRLLYYLRLHLIAEIPLDTVWYEVKSLTDEELEELRTIGGNVGWDNAGDNELLSVAVSHPPEAMTAPPDQWRKPILWGHEKAGPFTILEGNHRLSAYVQGVRGTLSIPAIVGLSPTPCMWHKPDRPPHKLANDLIKRERTPFTY